MDAESLVLALLRALPNHEIRGRKRLQKLAFFALQTGARTQVKFFLHDFGPYSTEVASATDMLSCVGAISEEDAQFSRTKRYYKLYRLRDFEGIDEHLPELTCEAIRKLDGFTTIELEVASTILYFISKGVTTEDAVEQTIELKPTKSKPKIVERAKEALLVVGSYERGRKDQVPGPRPH